jgi:CheY-like chemotaxis protein
MNGRADRTVMVVEDDHDVREVIMEILGDNGFSPLGACNGREALEVLRGSSNKPCVILLDIMMPVMDGPQFRAQQRSEPGLSDIPVVVLSAHTNVEEAAREMGAAGYMKKPVHLELLLSVIQRFCG